MATLTAALSLILLLPVSAGLSATTSRPSPRFVEQALCVHSGWHYTSHRPQRGARPDYWLWGHGFWRTFDVPDSISGGSGEGGWTATSDSRYGGGFSFMVGTWNRAVALSHRLLRYASSRYDIAAHPARLQIFASWLIVSQDGGSWREWPQTSRACGLG